MKKSSQVVTVKHLIVFVATVVATMSASVFAADASKDLLDLLLKKGVITQEEYAIQKDKADSDAIMLKRLNENYAKPPIVGITKEGEPTPIVTIYGIADVGIANVRHSLPLSDNFPSTLKTDGQASAANTSRTGMVNGSMQASRWGIRSNLDLGGGRKVFATLESGFNIPTGQVSNAMQGLLSNGTGTTPNNSVNGNSSMNGQLFGRLAFVGVSDQNFGSIAFGRQFNIIFDVLTEYDPVMKSDLYSPLGLSGTMGGGGGVSENTRLDNSIKYKNTIGMFNVGALAKLGGTDNSDPTSGYVLNIGVTQDTWGVQAVYEQFKDAMKAGVSANNSSIGITLENTSSYLLAGKYKFNPNLTFKMGYEWYREKAPTDSAATFTSGVSYAGTNFAGTSLTDFNALRAKTTQIGFVGGDYNLTPKLNFALGYYNINTGALPDGSRPSGNSGWTVAIADYKVNKYFDVYSGLSYITFNGALFTTGSAAGRPTNNTIIGTGLRFKF
jgi:GBP family porin